MDTSEIYRVVGEVLVGVACGVIGIISVKVKEYLKKKNKTSNLLSIISADTNIREAMAEARQHLDCDRVKIFQFKNGSYYISGESEQKITLTHIVTKNGLGYPPELIGSFTDVPVSFFSGTMNVLAKEKIAVFLTEKMDDGSYLKHIFHSNSIECAVMAIITTPNKNILGMVMFSWLSEKQSTADVEYISQLADRIGLLLYSKI